MGKVILENITKKYGDVAAVSDFNLDIKDGEYVVLVGPSGCGKSTTLRMIAGLEDPTYGEVYIGEQKVTHLPPKSRDIAMVFQNYSLYPHMTVYDNMAFALKLRKYTREEIKRRVEEASRILSIDQYLDRRPSQLSGGQRQRVALGRAIVRNPQVFLLDEPLSNLDAKLRVQMRTELNKLHKQLNTTSVYVTHDQVEAMTMGQRIVVMKDGTIQQVGSPEEVYQQPTNIFVASFIGSPPINFLEVEIQLEESAMWLSGSGFKIKKPVSDNRYTKAVTGRNLIMGIRPEDFDLVDLPGEGKTVPVEVEVVEMLGSEKIIYGSINDDVITAKVDPDVKVFSGSNINLAIDLNKILLFEKEHGKLIG